MAFFLFMIVFTMALIFLLWLAFRSKKPRTRKATEKKKGISRKKKPPKKIIEEELSELPTEKELYVSATKLMKKNPVLVSQVIKRWLKEK